MFLSSDINMNNSMRVDILLEKAKVWTVTFLLQL